MGLDDLDEVSGGYIVDSYTGGVQRCNINRFWAVNDKDGSVVGYGAYWRNAADVARKHWQSDQMITWDQLQRLRQTGSID